MNDVEKMQGELLALARRVERLETLARANARAGADGQEAARVAQIIGCPVEVLVLPERMEERHALARELRRRGWSFTKISRVMNCDEKTVRRWTEP
jgi:SOS response regulatory protein OraA/RecX